MKQRYHFFSHVEDLESGSLVFEDPFTMGELGRSWVCRYETHHAGRDLVHKDPEQRGLAAWHRVLPISRGVALDQRPLYEETEPALPVAEELASLRGVTPRSDLANLVPRAMAGDNTVPEGPWSNPYRFEGLKLLGLELAADGAGTAPVLVVDDPTGETILALALARDLLQAVGREHPYRVIALQERPNHLICRHFEGENLDWDELEQKDSHPPGAMADAVRGLLIGSSGTALALEPHERAVERFAEALQLLTRTGFVDDEDHVILVDRCG